MIWYVENDLVVECFIKYFVMVGNIVITSSQQLSVTDVTYKPKLFIPMEYTEHRQSKVITNY